MSFLEGLNDNYAVIKSQILLINPLPPLYKVFSMVSQLERQLRIAILPDPTILAASSQSFPNVAAQSRGKFTNNKGSNFNSRMVLRSVVHTVEETITLWTIASSNMDFLRITSPRKILWQPLMSLVLSVWFLVSLLSSFKVFLLCCHNHNILLTQHI